MGGQPATGSQLEGSEDQPPALTVLTLNEIILLIQEASEGGLEAHGLSTPIFTEVDSLDELREMVRDAASCPSDEEVHPKVIRLHFARAEVIAA